MQSGLSFKKEDSKKVFNRNFVKRYWKYILAVIISLSIGASFGPSQDEVDALHKQNQDLNKKIEQQKETIAEYKGEIEDIQIANSELENKFQIADPFFKLSGEEQEALIKEAEGKIAENKKQEEAKVTEDNNKVTVASGPVDATMDVKMELSSERKSVFNGSSNLPAGTELLLTFSLEDDSYSAQTKTVIEADGSFKTEGFSNHGTALAFGSYKLEVTTGIANIQPQEVKGILGENYGNVKGPLVQGGSMGRIIKLEKSFTVN